MKKLICILVAAGMIFCTACTKQTDKKADTKLPESSEANNGKNSDENKIEITLYFADKQAMYLEPETRTVSAEEKNLEKTVVEELIKGAQSDENVSLIPDGTRVIGANTEDGVCTVNLSSEFINNANGGSAADTMCVYSIVNSLAELDNVQSVQFLIDGEKVEIFGSFIFDEPFEPNTELNKK